MRVQFASLSLSLSLLCVLAVPLLSAAQTVNGVSITGPAPWIDVTAYGAKADSQVAATCGTSGTGNKVLTCTTGGTFATTDVGKSITVYDAMSGANLQTTTIQAVTMATVLTLSSGVATPNGATVRWSTDNYIPIQSAINAVKGGGGSGGGVGLVGGATIYFPYAGTGNYYIGTGLQIGTNPLATPSTINEVSGIRLVGECGAPGSLGGPSQSPTANCSTIISDQAIVMLTVGDTTANLGSPQKFHSGLLIEDLGFQDVSNPSNTFMTAFQVIGGIRLLNTEDFNLTNVRIRRIASSGANSGYGIQFDGGTDFTQFGVVINPSIGNTRFPIQTKNKASEINLLGGNINCIDPTSAASPQAAIAGSIGMDLGQTNMVSVNEGGEWGTFGTHILQCITGVGMFDSSVLQWWGIAEIPTGGTTTGTIGFQIDADADGDAGGTIIGGSINNYETCVKITSHPRGIRVLASLTPHAGAGTALNVDAAALPSTEILTPLNYAPTGGVSGTSIGSQLPDLTLPQESVPAAPASGSSRLYADSASTHVSAEKSDGTVVDLEAGLLNYQKAAAAIQGNGTDRTVYTFSIPSIPAGKGVRAKVWWTCSTCTGANKTFKWQFGSTVTAYAAITPVSSNLAYSIVTILNDPGSQTSQTMFLDTLVVGSANPTFGLTSNPAQNTSGAQSLTFLFNAANTETITPKGFVVEAIE